MNNPGTMSFPLVFFGTPDLARRVLAAVADAPEFKILAVVCQPDKPVGRAQILTPPAVKVEALARGIPVLQPEKIRHNTAFFDQLRALGARAFLVVAYGRILPKELLDIPAQGCVNIHGSLLPKWRGAAPIQYALMAGETITGVTLMKMDEGLDTGDSIVTLPIPIDEFETATTLFAKFGNVSGGFVVEQLPRYLRGELTPIPQNHSQATLTKILTKEDGKLNFSRPAQELFWRWKGLTSWPGVYGFLEGKKVIFEVCDYDRSASVTHPQDKLGQAILASDGALEIFCGVGTLRVTRLKPEGKPSMTPRDFLNGRVGRETKFSL